MTFNPPAFACMAVIAAAGLAPFLGLSPVAALVIAALAVVALGVVAYYQVRRLDDE